MRNMFIFLLLLFSASYVLAAETPLYSRWEQTFTAGNDTPSTTELRVEFTSPDGKKTTVPGYWDGGKMWRVRFLPTAAGAWNYTTKCSPPIDGLHGQQGTVQVTAGQVEQAIKRLGLQYHNRLAFVQHGPLKIGKSKTHLAHHDDEPLFFLADTCWTGPALSNKEDWEEYLIKRKLQGFTAIQYNALSPWRCAPTDAEGLLPYVLQPKFDINPAYFKRLDERIDAINTEGLLAAHVMVWANKKGDAGIDLKPEQLERLLKYQVARYGANNIFWILAGDNKYAPESAEQWKKLGRAVFADPTFDSRTHVVTTHPTGMNWPWKDWENETWLNVLSYQSGHGDGDKTWQWITSGPPAEYGKQKNPTRPVINLEPPYEDHLAYQSKKPHDDLNVRRAMIWSLLNAPTAGVTYGGHGVWSWHTKPGEPPTDHPGSGKAKVWREALDLPAAKQLVTIRKAFESVSWHELRPAAELLAAQPGTNDPSAWVSISASPDLTTIVIYAPKGKAELNLPENKIGNWFRSNVRLQSGEFVVEVMRAVPSGKMTIEFEKNTEVLILLTKLK